VARFGPWVDFDLPPMSINDLLGDPKTKAGANVLFRRKKRLEDSIYMLWIDAGTVVFDQHMHMVSVRTFHAFQLYVDRAVVADGVGGVGNKIGQGLPQFSRQSTIGGQWPNSRTTVMLFASNLLE